MEDFVCSAKSVYKEKIAHRKNKYREWLIRACGSCEWIFVRVEIQKVLLFVHYLIFGPDSKGREESLPEAAKGDSRRMKRVSWLGGIALHITRTPLKTAN